MPQKVLAGRSDDPLLGGDLVRVKVDQVILSKEPNYTVGLAVERKLKKAAVEVAVAYDTRCVTHGDAEELSFSAPEQASRSALSHGILVARPGIGAPAAVHLERFAAPARLALTDDPRMVAVGGSGMLTIVAAPHQLAEAIVKGHIALRPPRSVQILLSGRVRPFVCVRDVALELLRRGLRDVIERIDREHKAPVVLEFAGPSARLLSVPDRSLLAGLAPQVGAAGAVFVSDEKTEVYLRDQRRSKAHRALLPDPGAPCDDVVTIDLSAVDPLLMDQSGEIRPVRDLEGQPVEQVILGGDSGASLRDMLAAAALLKSKRVPPRLDFLIAPPSRQVLEVMAQSGALVDLIATGARLVEPDHRLATGQLYPPPRGALSLRTFEPDPRAPADRGSVLVSSETLAFAVASGKVGDPRGFKRPVRVTIPRTLPTDDVLVVRKAKGAVTERDHTLPNFVRCRWSGEVQAAVRTVRETPSEEVVFVLSDLESVRWLAACAARFSPDVRAVISNQIPTALAPVFAGLGILALDADAQRLKQLGKTKKLTIKAPTRDSDTVTVKADGETLKLEWLAIGDERSWALSETPAAAAE